MAVGAAHDICDRIEDAIRAVNASAKIAIHIEPESEKAHGIRVKVPPSREDHDLAGGARKTEGTDE
jgi:divalent metal cation (Fe/Co/Zn/Cd) transporter